MPVTAEEKRLEYAERLEMSFISLHEAKKKIAAIVSEPKDNVVSLSTLKRSNELRRIAIEPPVTFR